MKSVVHMIVVPHGYDATFFCGGYIAQLSERGERVHVVRVLDDSKKAFEDSSEEARKKNLVQTERAVQILGAAELTHLGYPEDGLLVTDWHDLREKIVRLLRQEKPFAVMSIDPWAVYDQESEHLLIARIVEDACRCSGAPLFHPEHSSDGLDTHFVAQRVYFGRSLSRVNHVVDISPYVEIKVQAMREHQIALKFMVETFLGRLAANRLKLPLLEEEMLEGDDLHGHLMEQLVRRNASEVGRSAGIRYGEGFRLDRFGELEEFVEAVAEPMEDEEED